MKIERELEIEYKTEISKKEFHNLSEDAPKESHIIYYFDTEDFKYSKDKSNIRLYFVEERNVYGVDLKKYTGENESLELTYRFNNRAEAKEFLRRPSKDILKRLKVNSKIRPFAKGTKVRAHLKSHDSSIVEIVVDKMIFEPLYGSNKGKHLIDYELEMEMIKDNSALFHDYIKDKDLKYRKIIKKQQRALNFFNNKE